MPYKNKFEKSAYNKRYLKKNRSKINEYNRKRYAANPEPYKLATKNWTLRNREHCNERARNWIRANRPRLYNRNTEEGRARLARENNKKRAARNLIKNDVLTHYGGGRLQCCWKGCLVTDIDMLSLDHIDDNGAEHRRKMGGLGKAAHLYRKLKRDDYPVGFQTLCYNHQMKKELFRKRKHLCQT